MKTPRWIFGALVTLSLAGIAYAGSFQHNENEQGKDNNKEKQESAKKGDNPSKDKTVPQVQQRDQGRQKPQANTQAKQDQHPAQQRPAQQPQRVDNPHREPSPQPVTRKQPPNSDQGKKTVSVPPGQQKRYSQGQQQQRITEQQQRVVVYRQHLDDQERVSQQYAARLQQDKRVASYRFQEEYMAREQQQRLALQSNHNYANDPYFYTANNYRYRRGGTFYETNQYGADTLRKAVNYGYDQGFRAGQADRQDRYSSGYQNSYAYQDANYGYDGFYSDQASYNYYFRQGFSRGYQDGYGSATQYGSYSNGNYTVLGAVLNGILNLQSLR